MSVVLKLFRSTRRLAMIGLALMLLALCGIVSMLSPGVGESATIQGGGHLIESPPGVDLTVRPRLTFGGGIACSDDAANTETDCIAGGVPAANYYVAGHMYDATEGFGVMNTDPYRNTQGAPDIERVSKRGGALILDGKNDYVLAADAAALDPNTCTAGDWCWTISAWVYPLEYNVLRVIVSRYSSGASVGGYLVYLNSANKLVGYNWQNSAGDTCTGVTSLSVERWYHVAVTFDATTNILSCYVNGVLDGIAGAGGTFAQNTSATTNPLDAANALYVGTDALAITTNAFGGLLDEVAMYNGAWTSSQVAIDYNAGVGTVCATTNQIFCYRFDAFSGTTAVTVQNSPALDGTLTNFDTNTTGAMSTGWQPASSWESTTKKLGAYAGGFDGKDDYLEVRGANIFPSGSNARTVEAWIYPRSATVRGTIFSYGDPTTDNKLFEVGINGWQATEDGRIVVYTRNNAMASSGTVTQDAWNHILVSLNNTTLGTGLKIFINGSDSCNPCAAVSGMGSSAVINTTADGTVDAYIGRRGAAPTDCLPMLHGCLVFDGTNDEVIITDHADFDPTDLSVMFWVKIAACNDGHILAKDTANAGWSFFAVNTATATCPVQTVENVGFNTSISLTIGRWYHFAFVGKSGTTGYKRVYVDGIFAGESSNAYTSSNTTDNVILGRRTGGTAWFQGALDEVRIYKAAIGMDVILDAYNLGYGKECRGDNTGLEANLVTCLRLNEGSGITANDSESIIAGSPHNGTLTNMATTAAVPDAASGWRETSTFPGFVDELAVWDIALTSGTVPTIAQRYNAGSGVELVGTEANLKAVWHFNDGPGGRLGTYYTQSVAPSGVGSDTTGNGLTTSTAFRTCQKAVDAVPAQYGGTTVINIASGVLVGTCLMDGYKNVGNHTITFKSFYNKTPNSFTNAADWTYTSGTVSATNAFPADGRTVFTDTGKAFGEEADKLLHITAGGGYCASNDEYNWHRIERTMSATSLSVITAWTWCGVPTSTTTYEIFNDTYAGTLNGGNRQSLWPGPTLLINNSNNISIKHLRVQNEFVPLSVVNSFMGSIIGVTSVQGLYNVNVTDSSIVQRVYAGRWSRSTGYTGFRISALGSVNEFVGNLMADNFANGHEITSPTINNVIRENLVTRTKTYAGYDYEFGNLFSYLFELNRGESNKWGLLVVAGHLNMLRGNSMNNNVLNGFYVTSGGALSENLTIYGNSYASFQATRNGSHGINIVGGTCLRCLQYTATGNLGGIGVAGSPVIGASEPNFTSSYFASKGATLTVNSGVNQIDPGSAGIALINTGGAPAAFSVSEIYGGVDGRQLVIWNRDGTDVMTITNGTATVNGILTNTGGNLVGSGGVSSVSLIYNGEAGRWLVVGWDP